MIQPIVLAAGRGTRLQSESPKALFHLMGKPLIRWVIEAVSQAEKARPPIIVLGYKADDIRTELGEGYTYVLQTEITGTATAVRQCLPYLSPEDRVLILYCDQPFISPETISLIETTAVAKPHALVMGVVNVSDFSDWKETLSSYGRVLRDVTTGHVARIVEKKDATDAERAITEINPSIFSSDVSWLTRAIERIEPSAVSGEYYLTDIAEIAFRDNKEIITIEVPAEETLGVNSKEDAERAVRIYARITNRLNQAAN